MKVHFSGAMVKVFSLLLLILCANPVRVYAQAFTIEEGVFIRGNPDAERVGAVIISVGGDTASFVAGNSIVLTIPEPLSLEWNPDALPQFGDSGGPKIHRDSTQIGSRTLSVRIATDFSENDILLISGLEVRNFNSASPRTSLQLLLGGREEPVISAETWRIGDPGLSLVKSQAFAVGDSSVELGELTIREDATAAGLVKGMKIRLALPEGFAWDEEVNRADIDGDEVDEEIGYEGRVAILDVVGDFEADNAVVISGLRVRPLGQVIQPTSLGLILNEQNVVNSLTEETLRIGQPRLEMDDQAFINGDGSSLLSNIVIHEHESVAAITVDRIIHLSLPEGEQTPLVWDGNVRSVELGLDSDEIVRPTVRYENENRSALIEVPRDLELDQSIVISGLRVTGIERMSEPVALKLSLDEDGEAIHAVSTGLLRIGEPELEVASQAFVYGDLATPVERIVIREQEIPGLVRGRQLRLVLPDTLSMVWDDINTDGINLQPTGRFSDNIEVGEREVVLTVETSFAANESVVITGLQVRNFTDASAPAPLELWLDSPEDGQDSYIYADSGEGRFRIGRPTLTLENSVIFVVEDESTDLGILTIAEDAKAAGITPRRGIQLVLPDGESLRWKTDVTPSLGGSGEGGVGVVTYLDAKTALIEVTSDFGAGRVLEITGLQVDGFDGTQLPGGIRLRANLQDVDNHVSENTLAVSRPTISSEFNQGFVVGDSSLAMAPLVIREDLLVAGISIEREIFISLPDSEHLVWDVDSFDQLSITRSGQGSIDRGQSILVDSTSLKLVVGTNFAPGDFVEVSGLRFNVHGLMPRDNLTLSLNDGATQAAVDPMWLEVGRPSIVSASNSIFDKDEQVGTLAEIKVREADGAASITPENGLTISLAEGSNVRWRTAEGLTNQGVVDLDSLELGGSAADKILSAQVSADGHDLILAVNRPFDPSDSLVVSRPMVWFEDVTSATSLSLTVTPGVDDVDEATVRVGDPKLSARVGAVRDTSFVVGDPERAIPLITIVENDSTAIVNTDDGIRLILPVGFPGQWKRRTGDEVVLSGSAAETGKVASIIDEDYLDDRTLRLRVTLDFAPGDSLIIEGLAVDALASVSLRSVGHISLLGDRVREDVDDWVLKVGRPRIQSFDDQSFVVLEDGIGDGVEESAVIVISEDPTAPSIVSGDAIEITIPDTLMMEWVEPPIDLVPDDGIGEKVGQVSLTNQNKTLRIEIVENFTTTDILSLEGLQFSNFTAVSDRSALILSVTSGFSINARDEKIKRIGNPSISSGDRQRFISGILDTLSNLTVSEDKNVGSIVGGFEIIIPEGVDAEWDALSLPEISPGGVVADRVQFISADTVRFSALRPLEAGEELSISGLRLLVGEQVESEFRLALSVNGGIDDVDDQTKRIAGDPSVELDSTLVLVSGDPDTLIQITITDHGEVPAILAGEELILSIPDTLSLSWSGELIVRSDEDDIIGTGRLSANSKDFILPVLRDFGPGQELVLDVRLAGLADIAQARSAGPHGLVLSVLQDTTRHRVRTGHTIQIGRPILSSDYNQSFIAQLDDRPGRRFLVGVDRVIDSDSLLVAGPAPNAPLTIKEDPFVNSITAEHGIRITIPESLPMTWLQTDTSTVRVIGTGAEHFAGAVDPTGTGVILRLDESLFFENSNKTVFLNVIEDFEAGDILQVEGLALRGFDTPARRVPLELQVSRGTNALDDKTKRVGRPRIETLSQRFQVGERETEDGIPMAPIVIREDSVEAAISKERDIRIDLTDRLGVDNLVWLHIVDDRQKTGTAAAKVMNPTISNSGRSLYIDVIEDFEPGDILEIWGLRYGQINNVVQVDSLLALSVNGDLDARSNGGARIGALSFTSARSQVFRVNDPPTESAVLFIAEDDEVPLLTEGDIVHIDIPQDADFTWLGSEHETELDLPRTGVVKELVDGVTDPSSPEGKLGSPVFEPDRKRLSFPVVESFEPGDTLSISGAFMGEFTARGIDSLGFSISFEAPDQDKNPERLEGRFSRKNSNPIRIALPTLVSGGVETFFVSSDTVAVDLLPFTLTEDADTSSIEAGTSLHIFIPEILNAQWDESRTLSGIKLDPNVIYKSSNGRVDEAVIQVNETLGKGEVVELSGLALTHFDEASPATALRFSLNGGATIIASDSNTSTKRIGNPSLTVVDPTQPAGMREQMVFLYNCLPTPIYPIRIKADDRAAALIADDLIELRIPEGFSALWAPENADINFGPKFELYSLDDSILSLKVLDDFAAGEEVMLEGLVFSNFSDASAETSLVMGIRDYFKRPDSLGTMRIGRPVMSSGAPQVFIVGDESTRKNAIEIREDEVAAAIVTDRDIRILIPSDSGSDNFIDLDWDTERKTLSLGGTARAKVESDVEYEGENKILVLDVIKDFAPGDNLIIGSDGPISDEDETPPHMVNFGQSSNGVLQMWPLEGTVDLSCVILDNGILYVGAPILDSARPQTFVVADEPTPLYPFEIREDRTAMTIFASNDIRIALPDGFGGTWDRVANSIEVRGTASAKVDSIVSFSGDTLVIDVIEDFAPEDVLQVLAGLKLEEFAVSVSDNLEMKITPTQTKPIEDLKLKQIGDPKIEVTAPISYALDATPVMGDRRGEWTGSAIKRIPDIHIKESLAGAIHADGDIILTFADTESPLIDFVQWDLSDAQVTLSGVQVLDIEAIGLEGDSLLIPIDENTVPGPRGEIVIRGLGLRGKPQAYNPDGRYDRLLAELPTKNSIGLIVHGRQDFVFDDTVTIGDTTIVVPNPNRGRIVDRDEEGMIEAFVPVLFDVPRVYTDGTGDSWYAFHTIPGMLDDTEGLRREMFQIYRNAAEGAAPLIDDPSLSVALGNASISIGDNQLDVDEIKIPFNQEELRGVNSWYDNTDLAEEIPTELQLRVESERGLKIIERGSTADFAVRDDADTSHLSSLNFLGLVDLGRVRFDLDSRYFDPGLREGPDVVLEDFRSGRVAGTRLSRAVLLNNIDGAQPPLDVETDVNVGEERLTLKNLTLADGLHDGAHELRLYFGRDGSEVLSFPVIRQFVIDTRKPLITRSVEGRVGAAAPGEVGKPKPLQVRDDTVNVVRPIIGVDDGVLEENRVELPITLADTLSTNIWDNIALVARANDDTVSALSMSVERDGEVEEDDLFFQMPLLRYPVQLAVSVKNEDGSVLSLFDRTDLKGMVASDMDLPSQQPYGLPPVVIEEDPSPASLELGLSLVPRPGRRDTTNFNFPLALLQDVDDEQGRHLSVELIVFDGAGHSDTLRLGNEDVELLIESGVFEGLLADKVINYPNPFRTLVGAEREIGTTLRFVITPEAAEGANVVLRIFDASGEQVYYADLAVRQPGEHLITWDGYNVYGQPLASGVYFAKLEVESNSKKEIGKLIMAILNRD
jgi:hypothetical protein